MQTSYLICFITLYGECLSDRVKPNRIWSVPVKAQFDVRFSLLTDLVEDKRTAMGRLMLTENTAFLTFRNQDILKLCLSENKNPFK